MQYSKRGIVVQYFTQRWFKISRSFDTKSATFCVVLSRATILYQMSGAARNLSHWKLRNNNFEMLLEFVGRPVHFRICFKFNSTKECFACLPLSRKFRFQTLHDLVMHSSSEIPNLIINLSLKSRDAYICHLRNEDSLIYSRNLLMWNFITSNGIIFQYRFRFSFFFRSLR